MSRNWSNQVDEIFVDVHRKAIINKLDEHSIMIVLDATPRTTKRDLYEEIVPFGEVDIVKRRMEFLDPECELEGISYKVLEEAVCLKNSIDCAPLSYIITIECSNTLQCNRPDLEKIIKCIVSKY
uniref:Uncharacterized protein n=1 Tax=Ignisphaera aggregans TaxID=334771 RepID=A0A7C2Z984_9CREN